MPSRRGFLAATGIALSMSGCLGGVQSGGDGETTGSDDPLLKLNHEDTGETWTALTYGEIETVGEVTEGRSSGYFVPVTLTDDGKRNVEETFEEAGVFDDHEAFEIDVLVDGESVFTLRLAGNFVETIESGDWDGSLRLRTETEADAERLREQLRTASG